MTAADPHSHGHSHGGRLIGWARGYDLLCGVAFAGREGRARLRLAEGSGAKPGDRILDIGCGTGSLTMALARIAGPRKVTGIDASEEMIARARGKRAAGTIDYRVAFAQALPFPDDAFDLVTSCLALHHVPQVEQAAVLSEIARVLAPSGRIYLIDFSPNPRSMVGRAFAHLTHGRNGDGLARVAALAAEAGFTSVAAGPTSIGMLDAVSGSAGA